MHAPFYKAALLLLASARLFSRATVQLSVTTHVPSYGVVCLLLVARRTAALSAVRSGADDEDDNEVDDEVEDGEDEDWDDDDEDDDEEDDDDEASENSATAISSTTADVDPTAANLTCPDALDQSTQIDPSATLYYAVVTSNPDGSGNGLFCGRLEVEDDGWIGVGFSSDGTMDGSQGVIGIPAESTVLKYALTSTATLVSEDRQTLRNTSIKEMDGMIIMEFTKLLIEEGEVPILVGAQNDFIHARGQSELGFHTNYASFRVDLGTYPVEEDIDEVVDLEGDDMDEVEDESDEVTASALADDAQDFKDCTREMCETQVSPDFLLKYQINLPSDTTLDLCENCSISMEAVYDGEAWVSIAFSTDGMMIGSEAVIGIPGKIPQKYILSSKNNEGVVPMPESAQTLTDASIDVKDGQTIMKFTKIMKEAGEIEITPRENIFLGAYGSSDVLGYHPGRSIFDLNLSSGFVEEAKAPNMSVWFAHGILAFLAWGVLVPSAVNSSLFRELFPKGAIWFSFHRAFNITAFALFVVLFSIAVSYTTKEGTDHFDDEHQKMGLAMFILTTFQVFGGIFRPHLPSPNSDEEKTNLRRCWESGHRLVGAALLACGFWQMNDGIELFSKKYSVDESIEEKVCIAYWVWIGIMSAPIVFGVWYSKVRKENLNDPGKAFPAVDVTDSGGVDTDSGIVMPRDSASNDES